MWSSTSHNKSQRLFLGSGGKWQSFPQQDKEMVISHGWDTKAMWRLFVYMHMMVWVVKYEVNYLNSFRQFPKGSVSGYCIILYCIAVPGANHTRTVCGYDFIEYCTITQRKKKYLPGRRKKVFPSYLPVFFVCFFFLFFFLLLLLLLFFVVVFLFFVFRIKFRRKKKVLPTYLPYFFQSVSWNTGIFLGLISWLFVVNSQNYSPEVARTARCTIVRGRK